MQLVSVIDYVSEAVVQLRYASADNVAGKVISSEQTPRLTVAAAKALQQVAVSLQPHNLRLVIWDAYRSETTQQTLHKLVADAKYVRVQSKHCLGLAIDLTLADATGQLLDMGTDHDDFSPLAHVAAQGLNDQQIANRRLLKNAMQQHGFKQWPYEWWHFDYDA